MGVNTRRLLRLYILIAFVTAVFLLTAAELFAGDLFRIAAVAIGSVTLVSGILGFVIAGVESMK